MFLQASVRNSVRHPPGRQTLPQADTPPGGQTSPWQADTPLAGKNPLGRQIPPADTPWQADTPLAGRHPPSRRLLLPYASYWNTFLFNF